MAFPRHLAFHLRRGEVITSTLYTSVYDYSTIYYVDYSIVPCIRGSSAGILACHIDLCRVDPTGHKPVPQLFI